jgi:hypothetical protein
MARVAQTWSLARIGTFWAFVINAARCQVTTYSLPTVRDQTTARALEIEATRSNFWYGPGADGQGPPSPAGSLGAAYVKVDSQIVDTESFLQINVTQSDYAAAKVAEVSTLLWERLNNHKHS